MAIFGRARRLTGCWALSALLAAGCGTSDSAGLACPILAPGALSQVALGNSLDAFASGGDSIAGAVDAGELAGHALWIPEGSLVSVAAVLSGKRAVLMAYGPRDAQGGLPACVALRLASTAGTAATATLGSAGGGEYLVLVGGRPGGDEAAGAYTLSASCADGCEEPEPVCPTLSAQGCADVVCEGELVSDDQGCPTCECDAGRLCAPGSRPGPWGTCIQPGCVCPDAEPDEAVCGVDGRTFDSRCHALCAGVSVAATGSCATACPNLSGCQRECFGPRAIDAASGCPTCECRNTLPAEAAECAACPLDGPVVCGTDGVTYGSRCHARCAGAGILYAAACVDGCREAPPSCEAECEWGLALTESGCVTCDCAFGPSLTCNPRGAEVCATLPGLTAPTTVGSPCLALALDATDAVWGPCGTACEDDGTCTCFDGGLFDGRCRVDPEDEESVSLCACSALRDPVCGVDGATWGNRCLAACAGVEVVHRGACCEGEAPSCEGAQVPALDRRACPNGTCAEPAGACASESALGALANELDACASDGTSVGVTACEAHVEGGYAWPGWCTP